MSVPIILENTINTVVQDIQANLDYVDEILWNVPDEQSEEFKTWLRENPVVVEQGWSGKPVQLPVIAVTIDSEEEADPAGLYESGIGEVVQGNWREEFQITIQGNYVVMVVSYNGRLTEYLARLVKWALLRERFNMEAKNLLFEQRVGMKAFMPKLDYEPDVVFGRAVTFSAKSFEAFSRTDRSGVPDSIELRRIDSEPQPDKILWP